MNKRSGRTLVELLVATFLFGIMSLLVVVLFRNVTFIVRKNEVLLSLQREALIACTWLNADLTNSSAMTFSDETGVIGGGTGDYVPGQIVGPGVVFAIPQNATGLVEVDGSGRLLWRSVVAYYITPINGEPCLVRRIKEIPPSSVRPVLPTVAAMHSDPAATPRVIARYIVRFRGDPDLNTPTPAPPYEFKFMCRREGVTGYGIEIENGVFFRN